MTLNQAIREKQENLKTANHKIDLQNKELEMQLVKKAMVIGEYGEKIEKVKAMLQGEQFHSVKDKILMTLSQMDNSALKKELNLQITNANQEFFKTLSEKFPDLTQSELRLCAFLKMNLSTKEIANITFKRGESIKVARSRLRKKLGLTHNKMAISVFLNQI